MTRLSYLITFVLVVFIVFSIRSQTIPFVDAPHKLKYQSFGLSESGSINLNQSIKSTAFDFGNAPKLSWGQNFGGSGNDNIRAIDFDDMGNSYITGSFSGELYLNGNTYQSVGDADVYVAKMNDNGEVVWLTQLSAQEGYKVNSYDIVLDNIGSIFITGSYTGELIIGESELAFNEEKTAFFAKINTSGAIVSGKSHHMGGLEIGNSIDVDAEGNIYIVVLTSEISDYFHASYLIKYNPSLELIWEAYFDEGFEELMVYGDRIYTIGTISANSDGVLNNGINMNVPVSYEFFAAKMNLDGDFEWALSAEHAGNGYSYRPQMDMDADGNIYLAGLNSYALTFGDCSIDNGRGIVVKLNQNGNCQWIISNVDLKSFSVSEDGVSYLFFSTKSCWVFSSEGVFTDNITFDVSTSISEVYNNKLYSLYSKDGISQIAKSYSNGNTIWETILDGNSAYGIVNATATDHLGYFYDYSYVSNDVDYFGTETEKSLLLSKHQGNGEIVWSKSFGDHPQDSYVGDLISVDTLNDCIFVTGISESDLVVPGGPNYNLYFEKFVFVIKYKLNGEYLWSVQENFFGDNLSVEPDGTGGVILSGTYDGIPMNIGDTTLTGGSGDGFVAKYNESGEFQWVIKAGGESMEYMLLSYVDSDGYIYITGEFISENIIVGDYNMTLAEHDGNVLVAKLDPDGNVLWAKSIANSPVYPNDYYAWPTGIRVDPTGYVYIKGSHTDSTYFDDILLTSSNKWNKFLTKMDSDGNIIWAKSISEVVRGNDYNQMGVDHRGSIYLGAQLRDTVVFVDDYELVPSSQNDLFIAKYNTDGALNWVKAMTGGETSNNYMKSISVHDTMVLVSGYMSRYLAVDQTNLLSPNKYGFICSFIDNYLGVETIVNSSDLNIYPVPSNGIITLESLVEMEVDVLNAQGQLVLSSVKINNKTTIDLGFLPKGMYLIKSRRDQVSQSVPIIIE